MSELHLFVIGKYKDKSFETLEQNYLVRMKLPKIKLHELKAKADDPAWEGEQILKKARDLKISQLILLDETGQEFTSRNFSEWLFATMEKGTTALCIGGAQGHSDEIKRAATGMLSLSELTLAHKLARLVLVEQLYRAQCLRLNHPYHND